MYLRLDYQSGEAIYRQIVEQIKYKIASGELKPNDQLPSIRDLAKQLKINPRTVVKVYEELQSGGLVIRRQGQGVFIKDGQAAVPVHTRKKLLGEMTRRMLAEASRLGAGEEEVKAIFKKILDEMRSDT
jgi:GntR family transcriptional regulator